MLELHNEFSNDMPTQILNQSSIHICACQRHVESQFRGSGNNYLIFFKGELQRQNKLISSERPFKILQNETKIIKIGHAVLEIFNFKD